MTIYDALGRPRSGPTAEYKQKINDSWVLIQDGEVLQGVWKETVKDNPLDPKRPYLAVRPITLEDRLEAL